MPAEPLDVLRSVFGHAAFRGRQEEVVRRVTAGGDAVVLFPTGAGKSMCYQIPSLCREGTGIVVSPLIALMRDQVEALKQAGVNAAAFNSTLTGEEAGEIRRRMRAGELDLLYVTPERLVTEGFLDLLASCRIALFAIDEAHCVSQWGHDFRPEYLRLAALKELFPGVPRIALTATADPQTREDLIGRLALEGAEVFTTSFDRPNIRYTIVDKDQPRKQLLTFLRSRRGESGIVYCLSRAKVDATANFLNENGIEARAYHAGMEREARDRAQDAFLKEEGLVLVATIAFGMGIDKPDVRFVAHLDLPSSVEAYYQETGRAGRDGLPSDAWMAYGMADLAQRSRMIDESGTPDEIKRVEHSKLRALLAICETPQCRRQALLRHFGEAHPGGCGNCDNCLRPPETWDGTVAAQKALSAIHRTGRRFGAGHVIDVLLGRSNERIQRLGHDALPTFGVGTELDERGWQSVLRQLAAIGAVVVDAEHSTLDLGEPARAILKGERSVSFRKERKFEATGGGKGRKGEGRGRVSSGDPAEDALFEALRGERLAIAREQGVPPYVVFHDSTLRDMARERPETLDALGRVPGVGTSKLARYGDRFLEAVGRFMDENPQR